MKLYLTDLDGTLLDHKAEIGRMTEAMMNMLIDNDIAVSYATARSVHSAEPKVSCINFKLPVITHNGAFIIDPITKERLVTHFFDNNAKAFLKSYFYEHKESILVYSVIDNYERVSYLEERLNKGTVRYLKDRAGDKRMYRAGDYEELFDGDIYYITLIEPITSPEELDNFFYNKNGFSRNYQPDTYDTSEYWYEIYRDDVSKANAALRLKEMLGADELIVFGDNTNDISMFSVADRCYAVSNATDRLKALATGVIRSNEQSGVPAFIQNDNCTVWQYNKQPLHVAPDKARFSACTATADSGDGVGILNEKQIHATLKSYFASSLFDKEIKIGNYFADLVTENGIFEIQTANFKYLVPKLNTFLKASHVTVVYPYHKKSRLNYIDKSTGEILKSGRTVTAGDASLLSHCTEFLDPFGRMMGLDGVILLAFILGFPANEIVVPIIIMAYSEGTALTEISELSALKDLFISNGWTSVTAICMVIFVLFHFPCSTSCITVYKETKSLKWTAVSFALPTVIGIALCIAVNGICTLSAVA